MSEAFLIRKHVAVKQRNPWFVLGFSVLTLGVYLGVWYYKVNRELRDYGETFAVPPLDDNPLEVKPLTAALAISPLSIFLFFIPIPVSTYRTGRRVKRAEELAGSPKSMYPGSAVWLCLLSGIVYSILTVPFWAVYAQYHLNTLWDTCRRAELVTEPAAELVTEPAAAAEWLTDPSGRHEYRYWDGSKWSENVSDQGQQTIDPLATAQPETPQLSQAADTKICPDCAEELKSAAAVCHFCGHRFEPAEQSRILVTSEHANGKAER